VTADTDTFGACGKRSVSLASPAVRNPWAWAPVFVALIALCAVDASGTNQRLFLLLNGVSALTGDSIWAQFNILGDAWVIAVLLLAFMRRRPDIVWAMVLAGLLATLWSRGLKPLLDAPRPPAVLPAGTVHVIGPVLRHSAFPSGHATAIFALAGVLALLWASSGWQRWLLLLFAAVVSASRSVAGVHWPLDLLGGMLGGWLAAIGGVWMASRWRWGIEPHGRWALALVLTIAAVVLAVAHETGFAQALWLQRAIGVGCALLGLRELARLAGCPRRPH
jgi:membrane-associated phospholipid phosphatase